MTKANLCQNKYFWSESCAAPDSQIPALYSVCPRFSWEKLVTQENLKIIFLTWLLKRLNGKQELKWLNVLIEVFSVKSEWWQSATLAPLTSLPTWKSHRFTKQIICHSGSACLGICWTAVAVSLFGLGAWGRRTHSWVPTLRGELNAHSHYPAREC